MTGRIGYVFDDFNLASVWFTGGKLMQGNGTYTYVASFSVFFPSLDAILTDWDTGLDTNPAVGTGMRMNPLGDDLYLALDSDGSELIPASGTYTVSPRTGHGNYGNWFHVNTGAAIGSTKRLWANFRMTGTPAGGGKAGGVIVRLYSKPTNTASNVNDSRPDGGNYPGSRYGA